MALCTWNINVFSVEPECCFVVIKSGSFPVFSTMTIIQFVNTILLQTARNGYPYGK